MVASNRTPAPRSGSSATRRLKRRDVAVAIAAVIALESPMRSSGSRLPRLKAAFGLSSDRGRPSLCVELDAERVASKQTSC
jgi:hypothetical protein